MKINADINEILYKTNRIKLEGSFKNTGRIRGLNKHIARNQQSVSAGLMRQKELINAITISQMAHSFIQKALEISSRLRDIANIAINSGKIQYEEFNDTLPGIKSSLQEVDEGFTSVIDNSNNRSVGNIQSDENNTAFLPRIRSEINSLKEVVIGLESGGIPETNRINETSNSLTTKASSTNTVINNLMKSMASASRDLFIPNMDYSTLVESTGRDIVTNPDNALISQGNLNYEAVRNIF